MFYTSDPGVQAESAGRQTLFHPVAWTKFAAAARRQIDLSPGVSSACWLVIALDDGSACQLAILPQGSDAAVWSQQAFLFHLVPLCFHSYFLLQGGAREAADASREVCNSHRAHVRRFREFILISPSVRSQESLGFSCPSVLFSIISISSLPPTTNHTAPCGLVVFAVSALLPFSCDQVCFCAWLPSNYIDPHLTAFHCRSFPLSQMLGVYI